MKRNTLIAIANGLFFGLTTACGGKGKAAEASNTATNLPVSAKADTLIQRDLFQFNFNAYLDKQHYDSLDIGNAIIVVHPNAAFFAFHFSKLKANEDSLRPNDFTGDSFRIFQFVKQKSKWEKIEDKVLYNTNCVACGPEMMMRYEDMNGDSIQDILLNVSRIGRNKHYVCYLQHIDKQSFIRIDSFEKRPNPRFDTRTMQLITDKIFSNRRSMFKMYIWKDHSLMFQKGVIWSFSNHEDKEEYFTNEDRNE